MDKIGPALMANVRPMSGKKRQRLKPLACASLTVFVREFF